MFISFSALIAKGDNAKKKVQNCSSQVASSRMQGAAPPRARSSATGFQLKLWQGLKGSY